MQFLLNTPLMCCCGQSPLDFWLLMRQRAAASKGRRSFLWWPAASRANKAQAVFTTCELPSGSWWYSCTGQQAMPPLSKEERGMSCHVMSWHGAVQHCTIKGSGAHAGLTKLSLHSDTANSESPSLHTACGHCTCSRTRTACWVMSVCAPITTRRTNRNDTTEGARK